MDSEYHFIMDENISWAVKTCGAVSSHTCFVNIMCANFTLSNIYDVIHAIISEIHNPLFTRGHYNTPVFTRTFLLLTLLPKATLLYFFLLHGLTPD